MTAYELSYYLTAIVLIYKAVQNLLIYRKNTGAPFLLYFAVTQIAFSLYLLAMVQTINATDAYRAQFYERLENAALPLTAIFFVLFTQKFRPVFPDAVVQVYTIVNIIFAIFLLLHPAGYNTGVSIPKSFPALGITIHETQQPIWVVVFLFTALFMMLRVLIKYFMEDSLHLTNSRPVAIALLVFAVTMLNDTLASMQIIAMPYIAHIGFLVMMFSVESLFEVAVKVPEMNKRISAEPSGTDSPDAAGARQPGRSFSGAPVRTLPEETAASNSEIDLSPAAQTSMPASQQAGAAGGAAIRINCLGQLEIKSAAASIPYAEVANKRKLLKLFKLLVLKYGKGVHKEEAISALWPDLGETNALNNLHALCFRLRKIFSADAIVFTEDRLYLDTDHVEADFVIFESLANRGLELFQRKQLKEAAAVLKQAAELYRGDFFEFDLYFEGADLIRGHLQQKFKKSMMALCEIASAESNAESLIEYSQRAVRIDDLDEEAWRYYFKGLNQAGKKNEAVKKYDELKKLLKKELDVSPDPRTESLMQSIKTGKPEEERAQTKRLL